MPAPLKILLVEDHADTSEIVTLMLNELGHMPTAARGFADALQLARQNRFDLAICDITLPDGDGCELFTRLKELHPICGIALTGHVMPHEVMRYRTAGFSERLSKPFTLEGIRSAIAHTFSQPFACAPMPEERAFA